MKIRLYMDEDSMCEALVKALRTRGVDVVTASDERMIHRDDADHLDYATKQGRVLVTRNIQDFYELHTIYLTEGKHHAGIILVPQQRYTVGEEMRRLLKIIAAKPAEAMQNHVEFLNAWG